VVTGVSFALSEGQTLGIVGESGSGKTVTALAVMGLLTRLERARVTGSVIYKDRELLTMSGRELRTLRGSEIAMIFQDPTVSLNPSLTIGDLIQESLNAHLRLSKRAARERAAELLNLVGIPLPRLRLRSYPHELSGGMKQRAMIAIALACEPSILIADEPTTSLDVTIQAQILELLRNLQDRLGMGILFITHDLPVVADMCDRVAVMHAGEIVEEASVFDLFERPRHPYTEALLSATPHVLGRGGGRRRLQLAEPIQTSTAAPGCRFAPRCSYAEARCWQSHPDLDRSAEGSARCLRMHELTLTGTVGPAEQDAGAGMPARGVELAQLDGRGRLPPASGAPIAEVEGLLVTFATRRTLLARARTQIIAVDGVGLELQHGQVLAIVGESGSGKSTLARAIVGLTNYRGKIKFDGRDLSRLRPRERRSVGRRLQMVFQDPYSSLDPSMTVGDSISEPLETHEQMRGSARRERVAELLSAVGLTSDYAGRYPSQLSGGQRQRVAIARAIASHPSLLICDEAVSSLDVSTKMQVIDLLEKLAAELSMSYIFITHDLALGRHIADRVAVMYFGKIVEEGPIEQVYRTPAHPYTQGLLAAVPLPDPRLQRTRRAQQIGGELPSAQSRPSGCSFHPRCPHAMEICRTETPLPVDIGATRMVACHLNGGRGIRAPDEQAPVSAAGAPLPARRRQTR
jgi:oligopeptide/dipeptide ABC transporter ATP-binding protein